MIAAHKNYFLTIVFLLASFHVLSEEDPHIFIDQNAQMMVQVLIENKDLFTENRNEYENKIKEIFEPMIDFKRVAASVMGKKYYLASSSDQRNDFVEIFKDSLLDTYAETLAQWENQAIVTIFPEEAIKDNIKNIEVKQILNTGNSKYPISYKLRKNDQNWMIINIIVNGVNLGLTFRNQFQALANNNNGNINLTLEGWVSDAGDAGISG
jgi:phospholipid transport system substrate-binding protein|tara:strand:- start:1414 stop:2043 length:630 start_codon:yes stop_codon:yes gene_type:complete